MKIRICNNCGNLDPLIVHVSSKKIPFWYYVECKNCHYCGKTKLFQKKAIKSWNKEQKENNINKEVKK